MPQYIAFLRGINLGNRRIKMEDLRALFEVLKFRKVATFIASGNVLFETAIADDAKLAAKIAAHLEQSLGYEVDTFVRTRAEVAGIVAAEPFSRQEQLIPDEHIVHVGFLREPLDPAKAAGLAAIRSATDAFHVTDREFYWLYRGARSSDSVIWGSRELRALKLPTMTMRNLSMLRRLIGEYPSD